MLLFGGGEGVRAVGPGFGQVRGGGVGGGERGPVGPFDGAPKDGLGSILATAQVLVRCAGGVLSVHGADRRPLRVLDLRGIAADAARAVLDFDPEADPAAVLHEAPGCRVLLARFPPPAGDAADEAAELLCGCSVFQLLLDRADGRTWLLTLVRDRTLGPFSAADISVLSSLGPAFRAVLRQEQGLDRLAELSSLTSELLDCLAFGVLLVDAERRVLWSNARARAILDAGGGLRVVGDRLRAADARSNLRLREIVHELAGAAPCAGRALAVPGDDGSPLQLGFVRLRDAGAESGPVTAVFLSSGGADVSARFLRDLYDLTPVEAEIARLICQGSAPAAAADQLRLSIHTVRDYLKPIFQKMGVRRQADMVRVAATFAGVFNGRARPQAGASAKPRGWN